MNLSLLSEHVFLRLSGAQAFNTSLEADNLIVCVIVEVGSYPNLVVFGTDYIEVAVGTGVGAVVWGLELDQNMAWVRLIHIPNDLAICPVVLMQPIAQQHKIVRGLTCSHLPKLLPISLRVNTNHE